MNNLVSWLGFIFILVSCAHGEIYKFTSTDGKPLEAELLNVSRGVIEIRRADGKIFKVPLNRFIAEDHIYVKQWVLAQNDPAKQWKQVIVTTDRTIDEMRAVGVPNAFQRIGEKTWEGWLRVGTWVEIKRNIRQHTFQYSGESEWSLSMRDYKVYGKAAGGQEEVLSVEIPGRDSDFEELRRSLKSENTRDRVSVVVNGESLFRSAKTLGIPIACATSSSTEVVERLHELKPIAIRVTISTQDDLESLKNHTSLECLRVQFSRDCEQEFFNNLSNYSNLGSLRTLEVNNTNPFTFRHMGTLRNLEHFSAGFYNLQSAEDVAANPFPFDKLPDLVAVDAVIEPNAIPESAALTAIQPGQREHEDSNFLNQFSSLVISASIPRQKDRSTDYNEPLQASGRHLRFLETSQLPDLSGFPALKHLKLNVHSSNRTNWLTDPEYYTTGDVRTLYISQAKQSDVEQIVSLSAFKNLEALHLYGNFTDLSPLSKLSKLKVLNLEGCINASASRIDLSMFPQLTYFKAKRCTTIVEIKNVINHPNLTHFELELCGNIRDLGPPAANQRLETLKLEDMGGLESIETFHQTSGLKVLRIADTAKLEGDLILDRINDLEVLELFQTELKRAPQ